MSHRNRRRRELAAQLARAAAQRAKEEPATPAEVTAAAPASEAMPAWALPIFVAAWEDE